MEKQHDTIEQGVVLILALIALGILSFLAAYFVSFALDEIKISSLSDISYQAYYLSEAAVQEAIFKIKTDPVFRAPFETLPTAQDPLCANWSVPDIERDPALVEGGAYQISTVNNGCAQAEIIATSTVSGKAGAQSQRVVRVKIFKAMGNPISEFALFTGGAGENISFQAVNPLKVYNGNLFANNNILLKYWSNVEVAGKALAVRNINLLSFSQLTATSCASNECEVGCEPSDCPPAEISMPSVDFDSLNPNSFLSKALVSDCASIRSDGKTDCVFTSQEFEQVMWAHYPTLAMPTSSVAYISGDLLVRAGQVLAVNGVIAVSRDVKIGEDFCWAFSEPPFMRCGNSYLAVKRPGLPSENQPSGIFAKRKLQTGVWLGTSGVGLFVEGLIYAGDQISFLGPSSKFKIWGGIAGRKLDFSSLWGGVDIYLDPDTIVDTLGASEYSPVITIDHWEEEY